MKLRQINPPRWVDDPDGSRRLREDGSFSEVGDAWYEPEAEVNRYVAYGWEGALSRQYREQHASQRRPIMVILPWGERGVWHCVDSHYHSPDNPNPTKEGWEVTGSLEEGNLTVTPSIHLVGIWHGHITNGEIKG